MLTTASKQIGRNTLVNEWSNDQGCNEAKMKHKTFIAKGHHLESADERFRNGKNMKLTGCDTLTVNVQ